MSIKGRMLKTAKSLLNKGVICTNTSQNEESIKLRSGNLLSSNLNLKQLLLKISKNDDHTAPNKFDKTSFNKYREAIKRLIKRKSALNKLKKLKKSTQTSTNVPVISKARKRRNIRKNKILC